MRSPGDQRADQDEVLALAAEVLTHLAEPTRLRLIRLLAEGERDVATLTGQVRASRSSVSQHLGRLRLAGLVRSRRDGRRMLYQVTSANLVALADQAVRHAEHLVDELPAHHRHSSV
ncbi:MAG TPA: metalloregulator ArsR/SmtB family transcription factor [Pseudonocardia sp.]